LQIRLLVGAMAQDALRAARACPCPDGADAPCWSSRGGDPGNHEGCPYRTLICKPL